jgi:hypothetical protein
MIESPKAKRHCEEPRFLIPLGTSSAISMGSPRGKRTVPGPGRDKYEIQSTKS